MEVVGSINTIMLLRICEYPNIETKEDFTLNIFVIQVVVVQVEMGTYYQVSQN